MDYTTQMDAARKGIITKELQAVAEKEQMDTARLMQLVAEDVFAYPETGRSEQEKEYRIPPYQ